MTLLCNRLVTIPKATVVLLVGQSFTTAPKKHLWYHLVHHQIERMPDLRDRVYPDHGSQRKFATSTLVFISPRRQHTSLLSLSRGLRPLNMG